MIKLTSKQLIDLYTAGFKAGTSCILHRVKDWVSDPEFAETLHKLSIELRDETERAINELENGGKR